MSETPTIFTIGHSTQTFDDFLALLRLHSVTAVADVRSAPYSRYAPQFNRESLGTALEVDQIKYVFLGKELGARSDDPDCYVDGRVQYSRLAETPEFHLGIDRLIKGAGKERISIMCTEKDPLECHRTLLVAQSVVERGVEIFHIHADGHVEPHSIAMQRLRGLFGLDQPDLFHTSEELLSEALDRQEARIAYAVDRPADNESFSP